MTRTAKARPISLEDIRYFECEGLVDDGAYHQYTDAIFHVPKQAWARANRLAALCCERKVSITKRSLYLCFTPALSDGVIHQTEFRGEVWQRYVMHGLTLDFNQIDEESRTKRIWQATINTLLAIAPEHASAIEEAADIVEAGGEDLAFPLASAKTKIHLIETAYTMPTHPNMARLLLTLTDRVSQAKNTCVLFESTNSNECGFLGEKVRIVEGTIVVHPGNSRWGPYYSKRNNISSFTVNIEDLLQGAASVVVQPYEAKET